MREKQQVSFTGCSEPEQRDDNTVYRRWRYV